MNEFQDYDKKQPLNIVVFTGGEAPLPENTVNYWSSPLAFGESRSPDFVVAADSGLETLLKYRAYFSEKDSLFRDKAKPVLNFSPDYILGDFDSISDTKILASYSEEIIEKLPVYKDLTDTEQALKRMRINFKNAFITLVGGAGGRVDHFLGIHDLFGTKISPDAWLCGEQVLFYANRRNFFVEGLRLGQSVSIARAASMPKGGSIKTQGLEWENDVFRKRGMPSISNTVSLKYFKEKRPVEFHFKRGKFILILPLESKVTVRKF